MTARRAQLVSGSGRPPLQPPSADLRAAVTLLGAIPSLLRDMPLADRERIEKLVDGATQRVMKVVFLLEPKRARLAKGRA